MARWIIEKVSDHLTEESARAAYDRNKVDRDTLPLRSKADTDESPSSADIRSARGALGLETADINELRAIGDRFTDQYNRRHATDISYREGRGMLLKSLGAHTVRDRSEAEGLRQQALLRVKEMESQLYQHEQFFSRTEITKMIDSRFIRELWHDLPDNASYAEFDEREGWISLYRKTPLGGLRVAELNLHANPLFLSGKEINSPKELTEALRSTGVTKEISRLFRDADGERKHHGLPWTNCHDTEWIHLSKGLRSALDIKARSIRSDS